MGLEGTFGNRMHELDNSDVPQGEHLEETDDGEYYGITFNILKSQLEADQLEDPLQPVRQRVKDYLVEQECSGDVVEFGTLILHELCANAIAVNETSAAGIVVVHVESGIYISVTDRAGGVEMITLLMQTRQNMSSALAERGRGLPMIGAICENLKATRADGEVVCGTYGVEELADGGKNVWAWLPKEAELSASA